MTPEATLADTGAGLVPAAPGWFVLNARDARWIENPGPWGFYCVDETADRHNAGSPEETQDSAAAYARFPPSRPVRYRDGLLPG